MIHKLTLRNFKGIESTELNLERLTVIVGPNASGKTSVLQAMHLLLALANPKTGRRKLLDEQGGASALLRRGSHNEAILIEALGRWQKQVGTVQMSLVPAGSEQDNEPWAALIVEGNVGELFVIPEAPAPEIRRSQQKVLRAQIENLPSALLNDWAAHTLLRLEARRLAEPSYTEAVEPQMDSDGSGLASVLAQMALSRPDDFSALLSAMRAVIPQVIRIRLSLAEVKRQETETIRINDEPLTRSATRSYSGQRILLDLAGAEGIPSQGASEGTLLVLGLLAALFSAPRPKLVLLDDLDRGLHPKAQKDLVSQLRKLLERDPELQIVATSHSPYLVDHLDPKEVRLSTVLPDGTIRFAALTQHPDFERWKETMRPGEFWSTVGESWVGKLPEKPRG
jgi:energy-coupling factor transporter ATP-binding protein EcfA2